MKNIQTMLVVLSGAFLATPVLAQQPGGYIGAGLLSASTDNATNFASTFVINGSADKSATGMKIYGGYVPNRFGIEAGYYDLGTYEVKSGATKTDKFHTTAFTVSGVGALPLGNAFDLNLKLGLAFTSVDYTCLQGCGGFFVSTGDSGVSALFGIGLGWRAASSFSVHADLEYFSNVEHAVGPSQSRFSYATFSVSGQVHF